MMGRITNEGLRGRAAGESRGGGRGGDERGCGGFNAQLPPPPPSRDFRDVSTHLPPPPPPSRPNASRRWVFSTTSTHLPPPPPSRPNTSGRWFFSATSTLLPPPPPPSHPNVSRRWFFFADSDTPAISTASLAPEREHRTTTMASSIRMGTPKTTPTIPMPAFGDPRTTTAGPPRAGTHNTTRRERRRPNVGIGRPHGNDGQVNVNGDA